MENYILKLSLILLTLCGFFIHPRIVLAESEPLPVMLIVDTSALKNNTVFKDTPEMLQNNLMERAREVFKREGLLWGGDGEEATMVVRIRRADLNDFSYSVKIDLTYQRNPIKPPIEPFACSGCSENKLVDVILDRFPEAAKKLFEERENARMQSPAISNTANPTQIKETCVPSEPPVCEHQETPCPPTPQNARPLYIAGGVVTGTGAVLLTTGIVLFLKKGVEIPHPTDLGMARTKNFKPGGIALMATGATAAVAGIATLAIATHVRKNKSSKKLSVYPLFNHHALGMGVSGRF